MNRLILIAIAVILPGSADAQQPIQLDTVHASAGTRLIAGASSFTRSVEVLDRADIDAMPVRSVIDVIGRALGADLLARSAAQADLSLRGGSFEQVLILVDGVPVNDQQTGHFHLDVAVPLDAIERIEILRGPASAVYGSSAVGGVVNIVTTRDASMLGARIQAGSFGAYAFGANAAGSAGRFKASVSADHDASDGHRDGTDHQITQARVGLTTAIGRGELAADAGYAARDFGAAEFYGPYDSYEETRTMTTSLAWRSGIGSLVVEPRAWFRQHEDDFILVRDDPELYRNIHTTRQTGAEFVARWQARASTALAIGGEASRSSIESNALGNRTEDRGAVFIEAAAGDAASALVTTGVRVDHHSTFGTFFAVSGAAGWQASQRVRLRASAANGFRAPAWTDRYYEDPANIGNPDLEPERFRTAEIGLTFDDGRWTLDGAGFVRRAYDLIDWGRSETQPDTLPDTAPWRTLNVEDATFYGAEGSAQFRFNRLAVTGRVSLITFEASETDGFDSKYALQPLTRTFSLDVAVPVTDRAAVTIRGAAARRADGETWETVDARVSAAVFGLEFFADGTNLFDATWLDVSAQPVPGRAVAIGIRARR